MNFKKIFFKLLACADNAADAKSRLKKFWGMIKDSDPRRHSLQPDMPKEFTIPGWIHGDGVPCTKYDSFEVSSWGSMLSKWMWFSSGYFGKVRNQVPRGGNKDNDTKTVYTKILTWSFRALTLGKWPDKDWQGKPWPKDSPGDKKKGMDLAAGPRPE